MLSAISGIFKKSYNILISRVVGDLLTHINLANTQRRHAAFGQNINAGKNDLLQLADYYKGCQPLKVGNPYQRGMNFISPMQMLSLLPNEFLFIIPFPNSYLNVSSI